MIDGKTRELVAIGASIAAGCQPCLEYHLKAAKDVGVAEEELEESIGIAKAVKTNSSKLKAMLHGSETEDNPYSFGSLCCGSKSAERQPTPRNQKPVATGGKT